MKASEVRQAIRPISLSWAIYENKVETEELQNFTEAELRTILSVASYEEHIQEINRILHMTLTK